MKVRISGGATVKVASSKGLIIRILALCALIAVSVPGWGQSGLGAIAGTVVDSAGAVIPNAAVTAKNENTGAMYKTVASKVGSYRLNELQLGPYTVEAVAPTFASTKANQVLVQVNTVTSLDLRLQPQGATASVNVMAFAPTVQTESSDMGTVVSGQQMSQLPLALGGQGNLRSPEAFVFLTPGTAGPGTGDSSNGVFEAKLAGGQNFGNEVILDGASAFRPDSGSSFDQTAPSVDALQEFKVTTSTLPAAYGETSGGVESFATKSGTNQYHGLVYDIFQNEDLNANLWFNNLYAAENPTEASQFSRPLDRKNDYGLTFGGPVIIPKLYNGRNKTVFFFSWEQFRQNRSTPITDTVPTVAQRSGDFSSQLGAGLTTASGAPLINPCTGQQVLSGQIFDPSTTQVINGTECRSPFPGNQIDTSRFSSVAQTVLALVPQPNLSTPNGQNNYSYPGSSPLLDTTTTVRIDENISSNQKIFFSYSSRDNDDINGYPNFNNPLNSSAQVENFFVHYIRVGYDYTISPSLLNHFVAGYNRVNSNTVSGLAGVSDWDKQIGLNGASGPTFPNFEFNSPTGYTGYGQSKYGDDIPNAEVFADTVTKQLSRHTLSMGLEYRAYQFNVINKQAESPALQFTDNETAAFPQMSNATGQVYASFLLGAVDAWSLQVPAHQPKFIASSYAGFIQDDYAVSKSLHLNLGLRYSVETPRHEADGETSNFSPNVPNTGATGENGALVFAGTGPGRIGGKGDWASIWKKDFAPRVGFSWSPDQLDGKTVLRGGFGIYYARLDYADYGASMLSGFTASPSAANSVSYLPVISLDTGIPSYTPPPNLDPTQLNGTGGSGFGGISYIAPSYGRPGMTSNWSLDVQHTLANDLILDVGYVGLHATHLRSSLAQINNMNPSNFKYGSLLSANINSPAAVAAGFTSPFPQFEALYGPGSVGQSLRPFPQYQTINTDCCLENLGQSSYDALLAKLERRFHNGLNLLASYTWSKTLTDADSSLPEFAGYAGGGSVQNSFNLKGEKSISYQDIPQTLVVSYIYELPVGHGKKYLNHGLAARVAGGWSVGGVQRYESGQPVSFGCATGVTGFDGCIRYNLVSGQSVRNPNKPPSGPYDPRYYSVFNVSPSGFNPNTGINGAFQDPNYLAASAAPSATAPIPFSFGDLPRVTALYRTADYNNEDFSILKRVQIRDSLNFELKTEIFNAFNRHIFSRPDTGPQDATFGGRSGTTDNPRIIQFTGRLQF